METKKSSALTLGFIFIINVFSQNTTTRTGSYNPKSHLQVYRNAVSCGDYSTAVVALNYVVADSKKGQYYDSLAYLYYFTGNYHQSIYWCNEAIKYKNSDIGLLELKATCLKQTKQIFKAIEVYEQLMKINPSPVFAFNLLELQYMIKRLYECLITTNMAESLDFKNDMVYSYKLDENSTHSTPLKAAFYNYKGLVLLELKDSLQARTAFENALSLDSNFILAKNNLLAVRPVTDKDKNSSDTSKNQKDNIPNLPNDSAVMMKK